MADDSKLTPERLVGYCVSLMRRNREALGFIEAPRLVARARQGLLLPEFQDGDLCGYLALAVPGETLHVHQACVQDDARRLDHGSALIATAIALAKRNLCHSLVLRCATDLPSNAFWTALGFRLLRTVPGGHARRRLINVYALPVPFTGLFGDSSLPERRGISREELRD